MATTPPSSDPQATQADTVIVGSVNQAVLQQANPTAARAYTSDFVAEKNEIIATQVKQLEATQGFPVTDAQLTGITVSADAPARFIVNSKYQDEIEAANAAQSVPEGTPPPTVAPADIDAPQPTAEFGGGKRFAPEAVDEFGPPPNDVDPNVTPRPTPVVPATNQQVPSQPDSFPEEGIDVPVAPAAGVDPQIPQPDSFPEEGIDFPVAPPSTVDPQIPQPDSFPEEGIDFPATPAAGVDPQIPQPDSFPEEGIDFPALVAPTVNPEVPQPALIQNLFTSTAVPVTPVTNSQVPQAPIQNIFDLIASLFSRTPTAVAPAANPQVAQAIPVPTPAAIVAVPIPPVANPQVAQAFPVSAPTVTTATPIPPAADPQVAQAIPVPDPTTTSAVPILPASDAQVPNPPTRVVAVSSETLLQNDPDTAREYTAFKNETAEQLTAQRIAEQEATLGEPISVSAQARIAARAEIDATADANFRYQDQIEAAGAGTTVPADTPPPTVGAESVSPDADSQVPAATDAIVNVGGKRADPEVVDSPAEPAVREQSDTRIDGPVDQSTFQQANPTAANDYKSYVVDTQNKIVEQQTRELEASQGFPASENQIALINGQAFGTATVAADIKFKDQIQAADAAPSVPTDTPPPTVAPAAAEGFGPPPNDADPNFISNPGPVDTTIDPEVPQPTAEFGGGKRFAPEAVDEFGPPPNDADPNYIPNAAPVVPTVNPQIPQPDSFPEEGIDVPVAPAAGVDPQIPQPDSFPEEGIDLPVAPAAGVDPQIPQPDSFPEEGIDLPAPVESPTPYERFLAQEAAATDAAQAAATARFNAQFDDNGDIIGSSSDPQAFPVTDPGDGIVVTEIEPVGEEFSGYEDFYGTEEFNNVGEFEAEPVPNEFSGYDEFYGDDTGEFQDLTLEPAAGDGESAGYDEFYGDDTGEFQDLTLEPAATNDTGYDEFYGDDTGEFQDLSLEPAATNDTGYDEFYGDDTGEFQDLSLEPAAGDGESSSFSNFFDSGGGGGDFLGGLFGGGKRSAAAVSGGSDPFAGIIDGLFGGGSTKVNPKTTISPQQAAANRAKSAKEQAKQQNIINQQRKQANDGDWRVRLRLAGNSNYLYNAPNPGILQPLEVTDGVIFPYTPQITTAYQAKYNAYELTHSNYKGYFYQGSSVGDISINATFTAQDTDEANYLLAVIHFFRSVTKMFYGQDDSALRGAPPPLVFLQGLGEYQFNLHPCVVSNFNYTLPADVDYIRALSPNNSGTNLIDRRSLQSGVTPFVNPSVSRLRNAGLPQGGISTPPAPPTLGTNSPTYVPTKMDIQLTLLAIQTRSQVSKQFSLKGFANGDLIKGGFW
jgi:hypothetical protein